MTSLASFFDSLETKHIRYAVLRNHQGLPLDWGNDVDILVNVDDIAAATQCLFAAFALATSPYKSMRRLHFNSYRFRYCNRELQIDLYTAISKAWFQYADAKYVLERAQKNTAGIFTPDPSDEVRLIAAKELFSYGFLREKYHRQFLTYESDGPGADNALFAGRLTTSSIALIDRCVVTPSTRGYPKPTIGALMTPISFFHWIRLRSDHFQKDDGNG